MSKRNITFTKPDEPNFIKRLKEQIGYKEGPTVDTKREELGPAEDLSDNDDEQPTVVVLREGDLTVEEATEEQAKLEKEAAETPADLNLPIVFKAPTKKSSSSCAEKISRKKSSSEKKSKKAKSKVLLSFNEEDDEEDN